MSKRATFKCLITVGQRVEMDTGAMGWPDFRINCNRGTVVAVRVRFADTPSHRRITADIRTDTPFLVGSNRDIATGVSYENIKGVD